MPATKGAHEPSLSLHNEHPLTVVCAWCDRSTPDEWVPRHPALVRLTGRHPFNCEPLLPDLKKAGFITPPQLHYVRNHGAPRPL